MQAGRVVATVHDLLEQAAEHRKLADSGTCCQCGEPWPCLVTLLACEVYAVRKPAKGA